MRPRTLVYSVVACLAAVGGGAWFLSLSSGEAETSGSAPDRPAPSAASPAPAAGVARSAKKLKAPIRLGSKSNSRDGADASRGTVDVARVEAALARLRTTTAKISRQEIVDEQRVMAEAKARFEAVKVEEPTIRDVVDEGGTRWQELRYPSGEVRYQLPPYDEDKPAAGIPP